MNTKHKFNDMTHADADVEKYYIWRILISLQKIKRMKCETYTYKSKYNKSPNHVKD